MISRSGSSETHASRVERAYDESAEKIRHAVDAMVARLDTPEPDYGVRFGFAESYDGILTGAVSRSYSRTELLDEADRTGRVLISGRGGAGKTVTLHRIAKEAFA